jgi:hypothetical protein
MKNNQYLVTVLATGILLGSCRKNNPGCDTRVSNNKDSTSIAGTWELHSDYSGFSGNTEILPDCNGNRLVFTDTTYKRYVSGKLAREGTYRILKDTMRIKGKSEANRIILDTDTMVRSFLNNSGTELHIILDAFDGPESIYIRRND